ncbi:hypothetical protein BKA67DRAFT_641372 [Truncatella angustata]|uniref:Cytochrome c oxidase assembly protein COX19 n=1 Tax=Truncatella angustata TaxID=152316 RepID=A0A9P9A3K2_9PEZI|nr:uncharacterized protein BKA67DRAFT_641372 [Truncatella angustata]KAH6660243.1 hypothetical protein BKA67DRAFT_641372 [Truncatella angustata]
MSSFGSPGGGTITSKPIPPERGSFPLDHDGECKDVMVNYLKCLKTVKGQNDPACRELAKNYLGCRMERNLMAKDDFKNLGFGTEKPKKEPEKGVKAQVLGGLKSTIWHFTTSFRAGRLRSPAQHSSDINAVATALTAEMSKISTSARHPEAFACHCNVCFFCETRHSPHILTPLYNRSIRKGVNHDPFSETRGSLHEDWRNRELDLFPAFKCNPISPRVTAGALARA